MTEYSNNDFKFATSGTTILALSNLQMQLNLLHASISCNDEGILLYTVRMTPS